MDMFFPECLNQGSKGRAVVLLQYMLLFAGYNREIIPDGEYGKETARGVQNLQRFLRLPQVDWDGNFGPITREALLQQRNFDVNLIPDDPFAQDNVVVGQAP